jgi:hypothetical protein
MENFDLLTRRDAARNGFPERFSFTRECCCDLKIDVSLSKPGEPGAARRSISFADRPWPRFFENVL